MNEWIFGPYFLDHNSFHVGPGVTSRLKMFPNNFVPCWPGLVMEPLCSSILSQARWPVSPIECFRCRQTPDCLLQVILYMQFSVMQDTCVEIGQDSPVTAEEWLETL